MSMEGTSELELDKKFKEIRKILDKLSVPCHLDVFSDTKVDDLVTKYHFPSRVKDRAQLKPILHRFCDFYFDGEIRDGDRVEATVLDVVALAQGKNGSIWPENVYAEEGFYTGNTSKIERLDQRNSSDRMAVSTADRFSNFKNWIENTILGIDPTGTAEPDEISLLRLFGFLALTLLRSTTKEETQLINAFRGKQYRDNLTNVANWAATCPFSPPSQQCIHKCKLSFIHNGKIAGGTFVLLSWRFKDLSRTDPETSAVLSASVLADTAKFGFGLITLLERVCSILNTDWDDIMRKTSNGYTELSWKQIMNFRKEQMNEDNIQICYQWARIVDHRYFRNLSPKMNPELATIFGAVIEKVEGPGIWKVAWVKSAQFFKPEMWRPFGYKLFEEYQTKTDT